MVKSLVKAVKLSIEACTSVAGFVTFSCKVRFSVSVIENNDNNRRKLVSAHSVVRRFYKTCRKETNKKGT